MPRWRTRPRARSSTRTPRVSRRTASRACRNTRRICPTAVPTARRSRAVVRAKGGAVLVDARCGLAFPACALAVDEAIGRAREFGVAFAGVTNSHHFGAAAYHLEPVGAAGLVGLAMGNSPAAMAAAGGRRPLFGTNPIAAVFPRRDAPPLVDRPVAVRSRARQADGRGEGGQGDSARLGARCATASPRPIRRPVSRARCCRWAEPRARCWRSSSSFS